LLRLSPLPAALPPGCAVGDPAPIAAEESPLAGLFMEGLPPPWPLPMVRGGVVGGIGPSATRAVCRVPLPFPGEPLGPLATGPGSDLCWLLCCNWRIGSWPSSTVACLSAAAPGSEPPSPQMSCSIRAPVLVDTSAAAASPAASLCTLASGADVCLLELRGPDTPSRRGTVPNLIAGGLSKSPRANMLQRKQSIRARQLTKSDSSKRFTVVTSAAEDSAGKAAVGCRSSLPPGLAGSCGACP
jgi:hypothetical protein